MNDSGFVTVIMPLFNRADSVGRAAASVLAQTHANLELIVVDDASTDSGLAVVEGLDDPRIRIIRRRTRGGPARARNAGMDGTEAQLIAFQDSDDEWHPNKLEVQLAVLEDSRESGTPVCAVGCAHEPLVSTGATWAQADMRRTHHTREEVLSGCSGGAGTPKLLIDLSLADPSCRFDEDLAVLEDRDFLYRLMSGGSLFAVLESSLIRVRRGRSDHQSDPKRALTAYERLLDKYQLELEEHPVVGDWYRYMAMREALAVRSRHDARRLRSAVTHVDTTRLNCEYALGTMFGSRGLSLAQRLHLRPDWSHRCVPDSP